jgi:hypothetical protein
VQLKHLPEDAMTGGSSSESQVNVRPTNDSGLWLGFELGCDADQIQIRAALILREHCGLHGCDHAHNGNDRGQMTVGNVTARLCKYNGHLELPPGYECLVDRNGTFKEALVDQCELYGDGIDVFVIEHMEIEPDHRGRGLGLSAMRGLLRTFATGETLAATRPMPTNPEGKTLWPIELREAQERLCRYWRRAGFERFGRSDILVRAPGQR